ncbi:hypothetical protein HYR99_33930 [Candidatus Poribacteria bacterium]|nr:hypothetical protein [Candidatus Poribacteria bacterium]
MLETDEQGGEPVIGVEGDRGVGFRPRPPLTGARLLPCPSPARFFSDGE